MVQKKKQDHAELDWEISFLEGVLRRDENHQTVLRVLAELHTRRGSYERGLELDRRLARVCPDDPLTFYNLACSLSLTHDLAAAFEALEHAWALGYRDLTWLRRDPDLRAVRKDPRYRDFLRDRESPATESTE